MITSQVRALALAGLLIAASAPAGAQDPAVGGAPSPDTVVAVVNGKKLTRADVIASAAALPEPYRQQMEMLFPVLIDRLVDLTLLSEEGRRQNLQEDPAVNAEIGRVVDDAIRNALVRRYLADKMTADAIQARYDRYVAELPKQTEVRASHILLASQEEARVVIGELDGGADFATLARSKSKDPSAQSNGGDLGYFTQDQMVPEFGKAAFALENGATTRDPVESQYGWHVIRVADRRDKAPPTLDEAREEIEEGLSRELLNEFIVALREPAVVEKFNPDGTPIVPEAPATQQQ